MLERREGYKDLQKQPVNMILKLVKGNIRWANHCKCHTYLSAKLCSLSFTFFTQQIKMSILGCQWSLWWKNFAYYWQKIIISFIWTPPWHAYFWMEIFLFSQWLFSSRYSLRSVQSNYHPVRTIKLRKYVALLSLRLSLLIHCLRLNVKKSPTSIQMF